MVGLLRIGLLAKPERGRIDPTNVGKAPAHGGPAYGLVLALSALPTGASENQFGTELRNLPWCLIQALVTGIPIGIASAVPVWTATMAGGVLDTLGCAGRPEDTGTSTNVVPFSGLFSLLACTLFFETGGPSRVVLLVLSEQTDGILFARLVHHLTSGIGVAIAVVSPVLAASTLGEIIVAVADGIPASGWLRFVLAPFRGLFMLLALGSSLELVTEGLRRWSLHGW
jgi:type III secretory pathway component EscT